MTGLAPIVVIEDDELSYHATEVQLRDAKIASPIYWYKTGQAALDAVVPVHGAIPTPALILVDMNLTDMSGKDLIASLKNDMRLANTLMVVLSASTRQSDFVDCKALGVDDYIVKPLTMNVLHKLLEKPNGWWGFDTGANVDLDELRRRVEAIR